jgi:hypothetical protein
MANKPFTSGVRSNLPLTGLPWTIGVEPTPKVLLWPKLTHS